MADGVKHKTDARRLIIAHFLSAESLWEYPSPLQAVMAARRLAILRLSLIFDFYFKTRFAVGINVEFQGFGHL